MIMNIVLVVIFFFSEQLAQGDLTMAAQEEARYQKAKNREQQPQLALLSCLLLNQLETLQHLNFLYQGYQPMDCHGMCHHHRTKILP